MKYKAGDIIKSKGCEHKVMIVGYSQDEYYYVEAPPFKGRFNAEEVKNYSPDEMKDKFWRYLKQYAEEEYFLFSNFLIQQRKEKINKLNKISYK
jgi:hypothetical protein